MSTTTINKDFEAKVKPCTFKDLSNLYNVNPRTMKKWLEPHLESLGLKTTRYYTIKQVAIIFEKLGEP